jgi:hypothetical protein
VRESAVQAQARAAAAAAEPVPPPPAITQPIPQAPPVPAAPSVEDKLRSLAKLRDDGIISPEEFEAKKASLLADL